MRYRVIPPLESSIALEKWQAAGEPLAEGQHESEDNRSEAGPIIPLLILPSNDV